MHRKIKLRMYSLGIFAYLVLLNAVSHKLGVEAGACKVHNRGRHTGSWTVNGVEYTCTVYNIPICKGGCAASIEYDVHISDSSFESDTKCSVNVNQCVRSGSEHAFSSFPLEDCKFADGTPAPNVNHNVDIPIAEGCSCSLRYSSATATQCSNYFIVDS